MTEGRPQAALDDPATVADASDPPVAPAPPEGPARQEADGSPRWTLAFVPQRLGEGFLGPLIPLYAAGFGAGALLVGVMESIFAAAAMVGAYVWGRTSDDARKRKPFILAGFGGVAVALIVLHLAPDLTTVVIGRGVMGFALAATVAVGGALVAERGPPDAVASRMGYLHMVKGAAYAAGLALGAFLLVGASVRELFLAGAALAGVSFLLGARWIAESSTLLRRDEVLGLVRTARAPLLATWQQRALPPALLLKRPSLRSLETRSRAYLVAFFLAVLAGGATWVLLPLYLRNLGVSNAGVLLVFLASAGASALLARPAGRLVDHLGYRRPQITALGARAAVFLVLALPLARSVPVVTGLFVVSGVGWTVLATTGPVALFRSHPTRRKGEVLASFSIATGLGSALGGLLAGLVVGELGFPTLFLVTGTLGVVAAALAAGILHPLLGGRPWDDAPSA